jgi:hypothetical protein
MMVNPRSSVTAEDLLQNIAESTHELSHMVTSTSCLLALYIRNETTRLVPDRVVEAAEVASRSVGELRKVMWNLGMLREILATREPVGGINIKRIA